MAILRRAGERHLLGYDAVTGNARLWRVLPDGAGVEGGPELGFDPGWTSLTPYRAGRNAYVLFYRARDGKAEKRQLNGDATGLIHRAGEDLLNGYR